MKQLGELNYYKISQGVKCEGSYDPDLISCYFIEDLYVDEVDTILEFLSWCHNNKKTFGHRNYEEVFSEFLTSQKPEQTTPAKHKFNLGFTTTVETIDIDILRDQVEEIRQLANNTGTDLSKHLSDFCFSVEAAYQAWHELDSDNFEIVHR